MRVLTGFGRAPLLCAAAGCAFPFAMGVSHAESASGPATSAQGSALEEVVVTARKREEDIQSVPAAITALSADQLKQAVIVRADDLQNVVPTLRVAASKGGGRDSPNYALRGLRSSGVVLYMSDIPISGSAVDRALYDLSSVQVLTGPQGTLFGKNTTAGAILFEPARPTSKFEGSAGLRGGAYAMYGGEGMINVPLSDKLMLRIAAEFTNRDGYTKVVTPIRSFSTFNADVGYDNDIHDNQRVSLLFRPTDSINNLTIIDRFDSNQAPGFFKLIASQPCPANATRIQLASLAACKYRPPFTTLNNLPNWDDQVAASFALGPRRTRNTFQGRNLTNAWGLSNITTLDLNEKFTLKNLVGLRTLKADRYYDSDETTLDDTQVENTSNNRQVTEEVQLLYQGFEQRLHWIIGGYYAHENDLADNLNVLIGPNPAVNPSSVISRTLLTSYAGFTQATFAVLPRLNVTAGARNSWDNTSVRSTNRRGADLHCSFAPPNPFVDFATCVRSQAAKFQEPSWTVGADYKLTDKILAYVTHRHGYNAGGFNLNALEPATATFAPEKVSDLEVGIKTDWVAAGMPVRLNVALYESKYRDIQRSVTRLQLGLPGIFTANAARATVRGAELELAARVFDHSRRGSLELGAHAAYLDAKYDSFSYQLPNASFVDISANALAYAPRLTSDVSLIYHAPISDAVAKDLSLGVSWSYTTEQFFEDLNQGSPLLSNKLDPYNEQPGYGLINLRINWAGILGTQTDAMFWVKNLTDELYATQKTNTFGSLGWADATYGEPRTWGVTVRYRFGT